MHLLSVLDKNVLPRYPVYSPSAAGSTAKNRHLLSCPFSDVVVLSVPCAFVDVTVNVHWLLNPI